MKKETKKITAFIVLFFIVGMTIGLLIPGKENIRLIREDCNELCNNYISFTTTLQSYLLPYNETDIVNATISGNIIRVSHTVTNEYDLKEVEMGLSEEGFIKYITQWKEQI
jgi:hypothetical protein